MKEPFFDRSIQPATGHPVGIDQFLVAVEGLNGVMMADDMLAKFSEEFFKTSGL
jgi:hypothetical protein